MNMNGADKIISAVAAEWQVPVSMILGESVNNDTNNSLVHDSAVSMSNAVKETKAKMIELGINLTGEPWEKHDLDNVEL